MSDFTRAIARISEGFCPIHGIGLRRPPAHVLQDLADTLGADIAERASHCGMCPRTWWVETVDERPMLRCVPELNPDERRFLYDRGES